jgi:membrane protein implicated in regulation of membrane protease activity
LLLDVFVLMLLGGALAGAVSAAFGAPLPLQFIVAGVTSVGLVFVAKPWVTQWLKSKTPAPNGIETYLGQTARTQTELSAQGGRIKLLGEVWTARLSDISGGTNPPAPLPPDSDVLVIAIDGATAVVIPAASPSILDLSLPQGGLPS